MYFFHKYENDRLTIEDQKEALTNPYWAFLFAKENIPGSDFKALQAKACEDPGYAYSFAYYIPVADIKYCQEHACKSSHYAYLFARDISGADLQYCKNKTINIIENNFNKLIMEKACK